MMQSQLDFFLFLNRNCRSQQGRICNGRSVAFGGWDGWSNNHDVDMLGDGKSSQQKKSSLKSNENNLNKNDTLTITTFKEKREKRNGAKLIQYPTFQEFYERDPARPRSQLYLIDK